MQTLKIEQNLQNHLETLLPTNSAKDVYLYGLFPGGKLFRAHLVWSILKDLNSSLYQTVKDQDNSPHALLASSIECHHTYTLLHDDLPAMDNDTLRRGKPCTHIAFNEWKALLTGDGLMVLSFQLLAKIKINNFERFRELLLFYTWATGPKGLINGQYLDLSNTPFSSLNPILHIHLLKTARLIQTAIMGSTLLAISKNRKIEKKLWKYSMQLGINFQLLDDLSELTESPVSSHEQQINPWILFPNETLSYLVNALEKFEQLQKELKLQNTKIIVDEYYKKMLILFEKKINCEVDVSPIIFRLKRFCD